MRTVYMIALESGLYLGVGGHATSAFVHAERWPCARTPKPSLPSSWAGPRRGLSKWMYHEQTAFVAL